MKKHAPFESYAEARHYAEGARTPAKGRPLASVGWRIYLHADSGDIRIQYCGVNVALWYPSNYMVVTSTLAVARTYQTISATAHNILPVYTKATRGREGYRTITPKRGAVAGVYTIPPAADLLFDVATGKAVNYTPPLPLRSSYDKDNRAVWLEASRAFRHGVAVRNRLGYFEALSTEDVLHPYSVRMINLHSGADTGTARLDMLYTAVSNREFPEELMKLLKISAHRYGHGIDEHTRKVLTTNSRSLRGRFNVFKDEGQ